MSPRQFKVLVSDEDRQRRSGLKQSLREWDFRVRTCRPDQLEEAYGAFKPDLLLYSLGSESWTPGPYLRTEEPGSAKLDLPVVILANAVQYEEACRQVLKEGVLDCLSKPVNLSELRSLLERTRQRWAERRAGTRIASELDRKPGFGPFVGRSPVMREVYRLIKLLAKKDSPVLISGESGTGKELVAKSLHELGTRSGHPMISLNAAAMPKDILESQLFGYEKGAFTGATAAQPGCFELAHQGILFLDEISEMDSSLQPKLLRVIETKELRRLGSKRVLKFDVRILAATNRDLREALEKKLLREDLYHRLGVFTIHLPPLRDRVGDLELLIHHFIRKFNKTHGLGVEGISDEVMEALAAYPWPGNVRELRNVVERSVVFAKNNWIEKVHLPGHLNRTLDESDNRIVLPVGISLEDAEKLILQKTLMKNQFNKSKTARLLGVDVKTIRSKVRKYKLEDNPT